jgi:drug/metabolite transporter (DMT)-like permease
MPNTQQQLYRGLGLGLLGVTIFALTLPMTRLAVGTAQAPLLSGQFVAFGRASVAGILSALLLLATRAPWPTPEQVRGLAVVALGVVFGFPLFTSIAMRELQAVHASVMVGVLPLATAAVAARLQQQRPAPGFWLCAAAGAALVVTFALLHGDQSGLRLQWADMLLLLGMGCAAAGYAWGARLAHSMRPDHVICWALTLSLPVNLPLALQQWPAAAVPASAWAAFAYVAVFSMWLGFFAWYGGLAKGGAVRVSQVQLVQPFLGMLFAAALLGEPLDARSLGFGLAVIATVILGRRMPVRQPGHQTT